MTKHIDAIEQEIRAVIRLNDWVYYRITNYEFYLFVSLEITQIDKDFENYLFRRGFIKRQSFMEDRFIYVYEPRVRLKAYVKAMDDFDE